MRRRLGAGGAVEEVVADRLVHLVAAALGRVGALAFDREGRLVAARANLVGISRVGLLGAAALTKSTAIGLVPFLGVGALAVGLRRGSVVALARWVGAAAVAGTAVLGPWVAWNVATYGAPSATEEVDAITGVQQTAVPVSLSGAQQHVRNGLNAFWDHQLTGAVPTRFSVIVFALAAAIIVAGTAVAFLRRRHEEAGVIVWLGSALPLVLAWMLFLIFVVFEGRSGVVGRHLYPAAGPLAVAMAAAAVTLAGRVLAPVVLAAVLVPLAVNGGPRAQNYLDFTYTWGVVDGRAPVHVQSYADVTLLGAVVEVRAPCAMDAIGLLLPPSHLPPLSLRDPDGVEEYPRVASFHPLTVAAHVYRLPGRTSARIAMHPTSALLASRGDTDTWLDANGDDPAAFVYCQNRGTAGAEERFRQMFGTAHPGWASRRLLDRWAAAANGLLYAATAAWVVAHGWRRGARPGPVREDEAPA